MAIKLELELIEVNGIMQALGNMPFAQVEPLINKIREQAVPQAQLEAAQSEEAQIEKEKETIQ
jgi:hypothetical protein